MWFGMFGREEDEDGRYGRSRIVDTLCGGHALGWMDFGFMIPRHAVMNTGWRALVSEVTWHGKKADKQWHTYTWSRLAFL